MRWSTIEKIEVLIPQSLVRRWHRRIMSPMSSTTGEYELLEVDARWPPACGVAPRPGMRVMVRLPDGYEEMMLEAVQMHSTDIEVTLRATSAL